MRRPSLVVLLLLVSSAAPLAALPTAAAEDDGVPHGPGDWVVGMAWTWEREDGTTIEVSVHEETKLQTRYGSWDVFMTQGREERDDGTLIIRKTAFLKGSHRRAYDEAYIYRPDHPTVTVHTQYNPPAPHPFFEAMDPGDAMQETVRTFTRTTIFEGGKPQPYTRENHTWEYTVWTDSELNDVTTPAGTFEAYNVHVRREALGENRTQQFNYIHSHDARHFVATTADGERELELVEILLDPPPRAHATVSPRLPKAGEQVYLDASHSYDPNGEIERITWTFPDGTTREGVKIAHVFDQPGSYEVVLTASDHKGQSTEVPVLIEVVDPHPGVQLVGPNATYVGEPTPFRLVVDDNRTIKRATWNAPGIEARSGDSVDLEFPLEGSYTLNVTFTDSDGNTGALTHEIHVIGEGGRDGQSVDGVSSLDRAGIYKPEDGATVNSSDILVIVQAKGLRNPVLVIQNGLTIPLTPQRGLATTHVPVPLDGATIVLQDGAHVIDRVEIQRDTSAPGQPSTDETGDGSGELGIDSDQDAKPTPLPLIAPFLILLPLLRRRDR